MAGRAPRVEDKQADDQVTNASAENPASPQPPKVNERGVIVNRWDNPDNDPNERAHVGEDPHGKKNKLS